MANSVKIIDSNRNEHTLFVNDVENDIMYSKNNDGRYYPFINDPSSYTLAQVKEALEYLDATPEDLGYDMDDYKDDILDDLDSFDVYDLFRYNSYMLKEVMNRLYENKILLEKAGYKLINLEEEKEE